ncbi:MAG: glycosyltransferase family 39 protein [Pelolinea sp.]|nr:glycosyltransferase family 39 protein [Pelolinea sp.]
MQEPSIYDYLKSLFDPKKTIDIREYVANYRNKIPERIENQKETSHKDINNLKIIMGTGAAILGQIFLEPAFLHVGFAAIIYLVSFILLWKGFKPHKNLTQPELCENKKTLRFSAKKSYLILSLAFLLISFILFTGNSFNWVNLFFWILGVFFMAFSFWKPKETKKKNTNKRDMSFIAVVIIVSGIILFFRLFLLNEVPGEMFSDHAEKLLDVRDILNGKYPIFFERNTGREPIQFYFTAFIIKLLNTEINFISLKIGTVFFGLMTLPFIYLIAEDQSNKWGGIFAVLFAGIGYWPNVISRVGLRYSLYPLFSAPVLYYLIKGLKEKNTNYLVVSGLFLGFGLHGYSSFRIVPFLIVIIILLYLFSYKTSDQHVQAVSAISIIGLASLSVFLPLYRYWFDHSDSFSYRALSRLTQIERPFDQPGIVVFIKNFWDSIIMPFYKNGQIWVHSIPNRPALDFISASFFFVGLVYMVHQIRSQKNWEFSALLISIPVLMLPSILSLAYPGENPSLNRSAGALVPIFIITGIGINLVIKSVNNILPKKYSKLGANIFGLVIVSISILNNYQLVFNTYRNQFDKNAWNTSEIGKVIVKFVQKGNDPDNAFVIPYPHWVDTRLVGFNADYPGKDYALSRKEISDSISTPEEKIFIFKPEDSETQAELEKWYPEGQASIFYSEIPGKEFIIYTVN